MAVKLKKYRVNFPIYPEKTEGKSAISERDDDSCRYPDSGPLNITKYEQFLQCSKNFFNIHLKKCWEHQLKMEDFEITHGLGQGTFGTVVLAKHSNSKNEYAIKIISKVKLISLNQVNQAYQEKTVLKALNSPFTIYLVYFFMDNSYLYFVLPCIKGGELYQFLCMFGKFEESLVQFYLAQVVLGLEYLHNLHLIYRDVKPENILIDHTGYLKLVDFGFSKILEKNRTYTLCGTPEYMAPEIILNLGHGTPVDWWATGVLAYELASGQTPFYHSEKMRIYEKIISRSYRMKETFSDDLKDLINNLLQSDLSKRYGNLKGGVNDIKQHRWFKAVNWLAVLNRKITPEFIPKEQLKSGMFKTQDLNLKIADADMHASVFNVFKDDC